MPVDQKVTRCKKCILPLSFPGIYSVDGLCSFCIDFENQGNQQRLKGKDELQRQIASGKNSKYDCLVPLSGGKDSSFIMLYLVRELGLNPLALLVNTGYQTNFGVDNAKKICRILEKDLVIVNPTEYYRLVTSEALRISAHINHFSHICATCEKVLRSTCIKEAYKRSINTIVWGSTNFEDLVERYFPGWSARTFRTEHGSRKPLRILKDFAQFCASGTVAPASLPHIIKYWIYAILMNVDLGITGAFGRINPFSEVSFDQKNLKVVYFFDYIKYDPTSQVQILKRDLEWETPTNTEMRFDCSLSCFANYDFLKRKGITKNGYILSTLIRHGLISRQEALKKEMFLKKNLQNICYETYSVLQKDHPM